jgi:hypothetical protein
MSNKQTAQVAAEQVIACNPRAIAPAHRGEHAALSQSIFSSETILEVKELENGYGFRLPMDTAMLHKVVSFIANERLCCPFFTFTLVVGEQLWLQLTGTPEVKTLIQSDILGIVQTGVFPTMDALQANYDAVTGTQKD